MSYSMNLPYTRFVRQVSGETKSITGWKTAMNTTFEALKVATWLSAEVSNSSVELPLNTPLSFTPSHSYDCYKMSSTVASSGKQICHMGMVAYRFKIPTDAIDNDKRITSMTFNLGADKFNVKGLKAVAYLSDTATPPTDWTICRTGNVATADITTGTVTHGVLPSLEATLALSQNKSEDFTLALTHTSDYAYLYIIVTNWDYADFRATREYYIEGSGLLDGATAQFIFDATSVPADTPASPLVGLPASYVFGGTLVGFTIVGSANFYKNVALFPGVSTNTITPFGTAHPQASATYIATYATVTGSIIVAEIPPKPFDIKGIYFKSLSVNLISLPMSVYVNIWIAPPMIHATNRNYVTAGYPQASTVLPGALHKFFFSNDGISLPMVDSSGTNAQSVSFVHAGSMILKAGQSYTETTLFPVRIPMTENNPYTLYVTIAPYNVTAMGSTADIDFPSELTGEIYFV